MSLFIPEQKAYIEHEVRIQLLESIAEKIDQRFEKIDQKFERIDQKFEHLENKMSNQFMWTIGTIILTWGAIASCIAAILLKN